MKNVKVYSTPTCPYCTMVKSWLEKKGIEYQDVNVAADQNAAQEIVSKTGQMAVPVTEIDGKFVIGYDVQSLEKLLS